MEFLMEPGSVALTVLLLVATAALSAALSATVTENLWGRDSAAKSDLRSASSW